MTTELELRQCLYHFEAASLDGGCQQPPLTEILNPDICSMPNSILVAADAREHRQGSFSKELMGLVDRQLGTQCLCTVRWLEVLC